MGDPNHRADMARIVAERRAQGLPAWGQTVWLVHLFHDKTLTFEERRDAVVARLRASQWIKSKGEFDDAVQFLDELGDTETVEDYEYVLEQIYKELDADRVWVK